jgi:hypothetical protein
MRRATRLATGVAAMLVLALGFHVFMSQEYGYAVVWDGRGNEYHDVECGNRYERGKPTADALRAQAAGSFGGGDLRHQADVVEEVCGRWTRDLWLVWLGVVPVAAYGIWWGFGRRGPERW